MVRPPALVFGVPIDDLTMNQALDLIGDLVVEGRRDRSTRQIATVNVDFLVNAFSNADALRVLQQADVCLADGMPVLWAARSTGMPLQERVAGSDLVPELARRAETTGWRIHLFGSSDAVAQRAEQLLLERHPGIQLTAESGPMMRDVTQVEDAVLDGLAAIDADILCIALGNPKQERFIDAHRERLRTPVMIGIGGSLDMLVGDKRRAPPWARRSGLEWVYRAAQEPGRLGKRYARDAAVFGPRLVRYIRTVRRIRDGWSVRVETAGMSVVATAVPGGGSELDAWSIAADALVSGATLGFRFDGARTINAPAAAQLAGLARIARRLHAPISVSGVERSLELSLRALEIPDGYITSSRRGTTS